MRHKPPEYHMCKRKRNIFNDREILFSNHALKILLSQNKRSLCGISDKTISFILIIYQQSFL